MNSVLFAIGMVIIFFALLALFHDIFFALLALFHDDDTGPSAW